MAKSTKEVWIMWRLEPKQALMPWLLQRYQYETSPSYILNVVMIWKHGRASSVPWGGGKRIYGDAVKWPRVSRLGPPAKRLPMRRQHRGRLGRRHLDGEHRHRDVLPKLLQHKRQNGCPHHHHPFFSPQISTIAAPSPPGDTIRNLFNTQSCIFR